MNAQLFLVLFTVARMAGPPSGPEIIRRVEDNLRGSSSQGVMEMMVVKETWTRRLRFRFWEKGRDHTLVIVEEPAKERGIATLKVGNQVWNYIPAIERVIKLPPSMMGSSWMGSHFTNDDLVKEYSLSRDYTAEVTAEDETTYHLALHPKPQAAVVWGRIDIVVDKATWLPRQADYFDERGERIRRLVYEDVRRVDTRLFPFRWILYPEKKPGERTEIHVLEIQFDIPIPDLIFTLRYLKRRR